MSFAPVTELCRLCLDKGHVLIPIFGEDTLNLFHKISSCLPVNIARSDKLPKKICYLCLFKVENVYQFWNSTAIAEKQLLQWLEDSKCSETDSNITMLKTEVFQKEQDDEQCLIPALRTHWNSVGTELGDDNSGQKREDEQPNDSQSTEDVDSNACMGESNGTDDSESDNGRELEQLSFEKIPFIHKTTDSVGMQEHEPSIDKDVASLEICDSLGAPTGGRQWMSSHSSFPSTVNTIMQQYQMKGIEHKAGLTEVISLKRSTSLQPMNVLKNDSLVNETKLDIMEIRSTDSIQGTNAEIITVFPEMHSSTLQPHDVLNEETSKEYEYVRNTESEVELEKKRVHLKEKKPPDKIDVSFETLCEQCGKYITKANLKQHIATHSVQQPFQCGVCRKTFPLQNLLIFHMKMHSNVQAELGDVNEMEWLKAEGPDDSHITEDTSCNIGLDESLGTDDSKSDNCGESEQSSDEEFPFEYKYIKSSEIQKQEQSTDKHNTTMTEAVLLQSSTTLQTSNTPEYDNMSETKPDLKELCSSQSSQGMYSENVTVIPEIHFSTVKSNVLDEINSKECDISNTETKEKFRRKKKMKQVYSRKKNQTENTNTSTGTVCELCGKYLTKGYIKQHIATHSVLRPFQCDVCKKTFKYQRLLSIHKKIHLKTFDFICKFCGYLTYSKNTLLQHERRHTNENAFKCEICARSFSTKYHLHDHRMVHSGAKPYSCEKCGKAYHTKGGLYIHVKTHETKYQEEIGQGEYCDICGKTVSRLRRHRQIHGFIEPEEYRCDICGKSVTSRSSLKIHLRIHTGEKPYVCDICSKAFSDSRYLLMHVRSHTGERPYMCDQCGKGFTQRGSLRIHKMAHAGHRPYKCSLCEKAFVTNTLLKAHGKAHGVNI